MRNALFIFMLLAIFSAQVADYPTRPIRMVAAYAPGGTTDFTARVVAPILGEPPGQTVVVDNRPGAGSILGTDLVAKGTPDGYALLMADTTFGIIPAIYSKLPFNVQKDFAAISQIMSVPNALVVSPSVAARSVRELVELAKTRPGQPTFGLVAPVQVSKAIQSRISAETANSWPRPETSRRSSACCSNRGLG